MRSTLQTLFRRLGVRTSSVLVAALVLAPAVGTTVAVLDLVFRLMFFSPQHVVGADRLVVVRAARTFGDYSRLAQSRIALEVAGYRTTTMSFGMPPNDYDIRVQCGTPSYLSVLGVRPLLGRFFDGARPADDQSFAVLSNAFWRRQYAGHAGAVGDALVLRRRHYTVVGIAPPGFNGLEADPVDVWIPYSTARENCSAIGGTIPASEATLVTIGRLRSGSSLREVASELRHFQSSTPGPQTGEPVASVQSSQRWLLSADRTVICWLIGGALVVFVATCTNAAALFGMRALARRHEMAVCYALGASRSRLIGLVVGEGITSSLLCAVAAWWFACVAKIVLGRYYSVVRQQSVIDAQLCVLLVSLALLACTISAAIPVARTSGTDLVCLLRGDRLAVGHRRGLRNAMLVGQVAVAFALVVGAGMFWRSIGNLREAVGYDIDRLIVVALDPHRSVYDNDDAVQVWRDAVRTRLEGMPALSAITMASHAPLDSSPHVYVFIRSGVGSAPERAAVNAVTPEYFRTVGVSILKGRGIAARDSIESAPVVVVSEELARRLWHSVDVVGKCAFLKGTATCSQVVGVVHSMRSRFISEPGAEIFLPVAQQPLLRTSHLGRTLLVRAERPARVLSAIQRAGRIAAPGIPMQVVLLSSLVDPQTRSWRLGASAFGLIGVQAFLLGIVGVGCSLSFVLRQRVGEIGVRMALGASRSRIFRMAVADGMTLLVAGWSIGLALAYALVRIVRAMLFGVVAPDVAVLAVASAALFAAGALACSVPGARAARLDPSVALRVE